VRRRGMRIIMVRMKRVSPTTIPRILEASSRAVSFSSL
jgi:hypothetical protein